MRSALAAQSRAFVAALSAAQRAELELKPLGGHARSDLTGMSVPTRVADPGPEATVPWAKPLQARRRRRKF